MAVLRVLAVDDEVLALEELSTHPLRERSKTA